MRFDPGGDEKYQLTQILNDGGIKFGDNVEGGFIEVTLTTSPQEITHGLGYTPKGFLIIGKDGEGDIWTANQELWNNSTLWLASNVTNLKVRLYVM